MSDASSKMRRLGTDPKDLGTGSQPLIAKIHTLPPENKAPKAAPMSFSEMLGSDNADPLSLDEDSHTATGHNHATYDTTSQRDVVHLIALALIDEPFVPQRWLYTDEMIGKMAQSIMREGNGDPIKGQITPVILIPSRTSHGRYEMVDGLTRFKAFEKHYLGTHIKAIVRTDLDQPTAFRLGYVANEERNAASDYDKGMALGAALDKRIYADQQAICSELGISKHAVSGLLAFATLPPAVVAVIEQDAYRFGYNVAARLKALSNKADELHVATIAKKVLDGGWTLSKLSSYVSAFEADGKSKNRIRKNSKSILSYGKLKAGEDSINLTLESLPKEYAQQLADILERAAIDFLSTLPATPTAADE